MMLVLPFDFESERRGEIFFIADHHIDERREFAVNRDCSRLATDRLPQRLSIVEIVRDDRAVLARDLHRFTCDGRRRFRERTETPAGMKPARAFATEDLFPIDLTRPQLRNGSV